MDQQRYAEACAKLEASQALDPASGTMLNLADCYAKRQLIASAWSMFKDTAVAARAEGDGDRAEEAERRAAAIEPNVSRLTLVVRQPPSGFTLRRDGAVVEPERYGVATPIDPGEHLIEAAAPGRKGWTTRVRVGLRRGDRTVEVPALTPLEPEAPRPEPRPEPDEGPDALLLAGWLTSVAGLAGIGVAVGFAGVASASWDDATLACPAQRECSPEAVALASDAGTQADIATGLFIGGGVVLGVGGALLLAALLLPDDDEVSFDPAGLVVRF
jgi:hypothetical protein